MTGIAKINLRAALQYFVLVGVVVLLGVWLRARANDNREEIPDEIMYSPGLPFTGISVEEYPEVKLGSDKAWEKYVNDLSPEDIFFEGKGFLSKNDVSVNCALLSNGQLIGRYHNANGTNLDLNGYILPSTGELKIHLGHSYNKTLSNWTLTPVESNPEEGTYIYEGNWGKKNLPSKITFKQIYN